MAAASSFWCLAVLVLALAPWTRAYALVSHAQLDLPDEHLQDLVLEDESYDLLMPRLDPDYTLLDPQEIYLPEPKPQIGLFKWKPLKKFGGHLFERPFAKPVFYEAHHEGEDVKPVVEHIEGDIQYDFRTKTHSI